MMENLLSCLNVRKLDIVMEILRQAQKSLSYFRQEILSETENGTLHNSATSFLKLQSNVYTQMISQYILLSFRL